jgi:UDP-2,4-diacetamido-2,4,6-trideoxy-beta-L-altropyranose hydrolase
MQPQKIAFRVDASIIMGSGHFMRCLTLAQKLKERGYEIAFICRHLPEAYSTYLTDSKIHLYKIDTSPPLYNTQEKSYLSWLGTSQEQDAKNTINAIRHIHWDWIIVDHYALDISWESLIKPFCKKVMVIDDLANRKHNCDILLDQNYYHVDANPYFGLTTPNCITLLGPQYALLRPEFEQMRRQLQPRDNQVKKILIFFGGVDAEDFTSKAIDAIASLRNQSFTVNVVIGSHHPNKANITQICRQLNYHCHVQTNKMAELIAQADICIGAGGSATWERCALGLPTITLCVADNQRVLCQNAAKAGLIYFPELTNDLVEEIQLHFRALLSNSFLRKNISHRGLQLIDTKGAERVLSYLNTSSVNLRLAMLDDMRSVFEWRNHSEIRSISRNQNIIDWGDHQKWFKGVLSSTDIKLLIGYIGETSIGVVRFDLKGKSAEISIYLIPGNFRKGLGTKLLLAAEKWLKSTFPEIKEISAEILTSNPISQQFFIKNGFVTIASLLIKRLYQ